MDRDEFAVVLKHLIENPHKLVYDPLNGVSPRRAHTSRPKRPLAEAITPTQTTPNSSGLEDILKVTGSINRGARDALFLSPAVTFFNFGLSSPQGKKIADTLDGITDSPKAEFKREFVRKPDFVCTAGSYADRQGKRHCLQRKAQSEQDEVQKRSYTFHSFGVLRSTTMAYFGKEHTLWAAPSATTFRMTTPSVQWKLRKGFVYAFDFSAMNWKSKLVNYWSSECVAYLHSLSSEAFDISDEEGYQSTKEYDIRQIRKHNGRPANEFEVFGEKSLGRVQYCPLDFTQYSDGRHGEYDTMVYSNCRVSAAHEKASRARLGEFESVTSSAHTVGLTFKNLTLRCSEPRERSWVFNDVAQYTIVKHYCDLWNEIRQSSHLMMTATVVMEDIGEASFPLSVNPRPPRATRKPSSSSGSEHSVWLADVRRAVASGNPCDPVPLQPLPPRSPSPIRPPTFVSSARPQSARSQPSSLGGAGGGVLRARPASAGVSVISASTPSDSRSTTSMSQNGWEGAQVETAKENSGGSRLLRVDFPNPFHVANDHTIKQSGLQNMVRDISGEQQSKKYHTSRLSKKLMDNVSRYSIAEQDKPNEKGVFDVVQEVPIKSYDDVIVAESENESDIFNKPSFRQEKFNEVLSAFTHFAAYKSRHTLLFEVSGILNGCISNVKIHTNDGIGFNNNKGVAAFKDFFSSHKCGPLCDPKWIFPPYI